MNIRMEKLGCLKLKNIIFLEPQCKNKEHALFNAAVINRLTIGYDKAYIFAEQTHIAVLNGFLKVHKECFPIEKFPDGILFRVLHYFKIYREVFNKKSGGSELIVLSMSTLQLILLPLYALIFQKVTIYHHSLVENLYSNTLLKRYIYYIIFWYLGSISKIVNIFLGEHVRDNLRKLGFNNKNFVFIRLPFEPSVNLLPQGRLKKAFNVLTFGKQTFEKGFRDNLWLWENLNSRGIDCKIAGFGNRAVIDYLTAQNSNLYLSDIMSEQEELDALIQSADIIFFTYPKELYRVSSSGAYFDAVACEKKIVAYQDNQFFAHEKSSYSELTLCLDKNEMLNYIINIYDTQKMVK
jgi:hypothetical protein